MKNYTDRSVRLFFFCLSLSTFFACVNGTKKLSMNNQEEKTTPAGKPAIFNKLLYLLDNDIEYFLQGNGSIEEFSKYLQGESRGKDYREYLERNSKTDKIDPLEQSYSRERINMLDDYFHNRLEMKNIRSERNINDLRLGPWPISICLIHYIQRNMPFIHEKKLEYKFIESFNTLINKGVDVNQADFLGNTPILELTRLAGSCILRRPSSFKEFITFFEYMIGYLLDKGADPTKKTIKKNSAEICIEDLHRGDPHNKDLERIFNKIKLYAAKFKNSQEAKEAVWV